MQPQTDQVRADQVRNDAGGFVFGIDKWARLDRFLILGTEGGTYYTDEKQLTERSYKSLNECLSENGMRTVSRIVEISEGGRAPKNDAAIFALAVAAGDKNPGTRAAALAALPKVCRIGTHLFQFVAELTVMKSRGWGRSLRRAVSQWFLQTRPADLAYSLLKYQQREGWSNKDMLRLSHARASTPEHGALLRWAACHKDLGATTFDARTIVRKSGKVEKTYGAVDRDRLPAIIGAFEQIHRATDVRDVCRLIREHRLPHEAVPNQWKTKEEVWDALVDHMGLTAIVRNLARMTAVGLIEPMSDGTKRVIARLSDTEALRKARVHPMSILLAMGVYKNGHGERGKLTWNPVQPVVDALDGAFYGAFANVTPTGKRIVLALDVSGSMGSPLGGTTLTAREAAAAMAMVTARTESQHLVLSFSGGRASAGRARAIGYPCDAGCEPLAISPRQRLDDIVHHVTNKPFGPTDCAQPMLYAAQHNIEADVFVTYTDNETWQGEVHPYIALEQYRRKTGIKAKFIACAMTATEYSVADQTDPLSMDIVGFDANVPTIIDSFIRGAAKEVDKS